MVYNDDEIRRLLREERTRGKGKHPPLSEEVVKRKLEQLRVVENLLAEQNFQRFLGRLSEAGLLPGSYEYTLAAVAWLDHWRGQR
jgi:hypothetical protein